MISYLFAILFKIIYLVIIVVVLLSWIPIFDTKKEPILTLIKIYDYIMAPFKAIIPPIGMIDISPVVAIIVIQIVERLLLKILIGIGL
ncbi:MAG: YggT family protein [Candidatus Gastranaerophilales bacterium]|nr:YggT family protein [Candidatus Gastranaerophilales bacterium]